MDAPAGEHHGGVEHPSVGRAPGCADNGGDSVGCLGNAHKSLTDSAVQAGVEEQVFAGVAGDAKFREQCNGDALIGKLAQVG